MSTHPRAVRLSAGPHADRADGRSGTQACRPPAAQSAAPLASEKDIAIHIEHWYNVYQER
jgi:hypothetical protein